MLQKLVTLLYLSGEAMSIQALAGLLEVTPKEVEEHIPELSRALDALGLSLLRSAEGIAIVTQSSQAMLVEAFWKSELKGELTPATLQVLTLVAYLENPTREDISYIRGVQSSQSIRTLTVRGLIARQGEVCTLTSDALKQLGVVNVTELPDYEALHKELREKLDAKES